MRKHSDVADSSVVSCIHPAEVAAMRARLAGIAEVERATAVFALLAQAHPGGPPGCGRPCQGAGC